jgi:hypothetical protein
MTATLIGHSEFAGVTPSSPPKKYRIRSWSGTRQVCDWGNVDCSGDRANQSNQTWSGSCEYDATTGATTNDSRQDVGIDPASAPCSAVALTDFATLACDAEAPNGGAATSGEATVTIGKTEKEYDFGVTPCRALSGFYRTSTGVLTITLSAEDTEDDAEDRAAAGVESWTACTGACICTTLTAFRQNRGDGFSWSARVVRIKARGTGLVESSSYQATIQYQRRPYGSTDPDAWVDFAQEFQNLFTGAGETTATAADWVEIPNTRGYETRARCSGIELIT